MYQCRYYFFCSILRIQTKNFSPQSKLHRAGSLFPVVPVKIRILLLCRVHLLPIRNFESENYGGFGLKIKHKLRLTTHRLTYAHAVSNFVYLNERVNDTGVSLPNYYYYEGFWLKINHQLRLIRWTGDHVLSNDVHDKTKMNGTWVIGKI